MSVKLPTVKKRVSGPIRFVLTLGIVVCVLLFFVGVAGVFSTGSAAFFPSKPNPSRVIPILKFVGVLALSGGLLWLASRVNRILNGSNGTSLSKRKANPFVCLGCACEAPVKDVSFNKHTGMVFIMHHESLKGHFCRECSAQTFWKYTPWTLFLGWWGLISFIITPIVLIGNT